MTRGHLWNLCPGCNAAACRCPEPDFDGVDECRRCHRVDLRAPRPDRTRRADAMTRVYRVTTSKELGDVLAERYRHFTSWWQAYKYSRAMRHAGYITRTERIR